jgi:hypothetical protein
MPVDQILFSSVSRESPSEKNASLLQDTAQYVKRSKGIKTLFSLGACGFSWALLAPFSSGVEPYLEQGRSITKLCKSTFRIPKLVMKGSGVWNRGEKVRGTSIAVAKRITSDPLDSKVLRRVLYVATDAFAWFASFMKWGCGALGLADKKFLRSFYKELPDQVAQVGVAAGLASTGMKLMSAGGELRAARQTVLPRNQHLVEARTKVVDNLMFKTAALVLKFFSIILSGIGVFAFYPIAPLVMHVTSTVSLGFGITAFRIEQQSTLEPKRVSVIA